MEEGETHAPFKVLEFDAIGVNQGLDFVLIGRDLLQVHHLTVVCPPAEFEMTFLLVVRKILDINLQPSHLQVKKEGMKC